jgi:hypothetical protein
MRAVVDPGSRETGASRNHRHILGIGLAILSRSVCRPGRRGLQLDDSPPDPFPDGLPFEIAAVEHQVGVSSRFKFCVGTVPPYEQVGGSPDVEV